MGLPNIKTTILIAIILIVPYGLKFTIAEPYPAIILPSGHQIIEITSSEYTFESIEIEGIPNGKEQYSSIPAADFLNPAPTRLLRSFAINDFGLVKKEGLKAANENTISQAKTWYASKLKTLGYKPHRFKVVMYSNVIDKEKNTIISKAATSEVIYELY